MRRIYHSSLFTGLILFVFISIWLCEKEQLPDNTENGINPTTENVYFLLKTGNYRTYKYPRSSSNDDYNIIVK